MSEKKPRSRRAKFIIFVLIKFPIFIAIIGLIFAFALKVIERYPDPVRQGLEQYVSGASNTNASIGKIEDFSFIPKVKATLSEVTLHNRVNAAEIRASVEKITFAAPFWSGLFGGGKVSQLDIQNLETIAGFPLPFGINLKTVNIIDKEGPDQYGSFIIGSGRYRGEDLSFETKLEKRKNYYKILSQLPFFLTVGTRTVEGTIATSYKKINLENLVYESGAQASEAREYALVKGEDYIIDNPLSCLLIEDDINTCDKYLNE